MLGAAGRRMAVSPFDSVIFGPLFGAPATAALFSDAATVAAMVEVERALARAQGRCGVIPTAAAAAIDAGLADVAIPPEALAAGTAAAGVPVPALVEALRARLAPEAGQWLHWGATMGGLSTTTPVAAGASREHPWRREYPASMRTRQSLST